MTSASQIHPWKSQTKTFILVLKSNTPDPYLFLWWQNSFKYDKNVKDDIYMIACKLVVAMYYVSKKWTLSWETKMGTTDT